jgi:hypothetical protein
MNTGIKITASIFGIVGLGMGALHVLLAVFGFGGMDPSLSVWIGILVPLMAELLALTAFIMLWWRPRIAAGIFVAASLVFLGALVLFDSVFAHASGPDLLVALFTTPHNVYILPAWLPLLFAGLLAWRVSDARNLA